MKTGYLIAAVVITVLLLIIAFQNIQTHASFIMFFSFKNMSMTFPVFMLSVLGMAAGAFYTLAILSMVDKRREDFRDEEGSEF
jgi:hypothetical protein